MRIRTRQFTTPSGSRGPSPPEYDSLDVVSSGFETCKDLPGMLGDNLGFSVERSTFSGGRLYKPSTNGSEWARGYVSQWNRQLDAYARSHIYYDTPSNGELAVDLLNRTKPDRPLVDAATTLGEIRDLPSLFRRSYGGVISRNAKDFLWLQFGVKPIVSDAMKLFQFHDVMERRLKQLRRFSINGYLKRTIDLASYSVQEHVHDTTFHSGVPFSMSGKLHKQTVQKVRGHVRYAWDGLVPFPESDQEMRSLLRKAILGLRVDISTFWEILPWSWLIDWYSNVGDYLSATRNILPIHVASLSIMRHTVTTVSSYDHYSGSFGATMSPIRATYETKARDLTVPAFSMSVPLLSGTQLGILGALAFKDGRNGNLNPRVL